MVTDYSNLIPKAQLQRMVEEWIQDDMPSHMDVGGFVVGAESHVAKLWMKSPGVVAGKVFVNAIFESLSCQVEWHVEEGSNVSLFSNVNNSNNNSNNNSSNKIHVATVTGPVNQILRGERTALNALSRCSGVATASRQAVERAQSLGWKGWVAGTRKTTPGFRLVEKYGLLVGGAATHRLDLSQMVMLKDNHIWSMGSITNAVKLARQVAGFSQKIEVECQSLEDAMEAAAAGADIVMLDNLEPAELKENAKKFKEVHPQVLVEASGGITVATMADYLSEHVDIISQGKLTQGYACLDFSLKIEKR